MRKYDFNYNHRRNQAIFSIFIILVVLIIWIVYMDDIVALLNEFFAEIGLFFSAVPLVAGTKDPLLIIHDELLKLCHDTGKHPDKLRIWKAANYVGQFVRAERYDMAATHLKGLTWLLVEDYIDWDYHPVENAINQLKEEEDAI